MEPAHDQRSWKNEARADLGKEGRIRIQGRVDFRPRAAIVRVHFRNLYVTASQFERRKHNRRETKRTKTV
jgi:hypothetical protein